MSPDEMFCYNVFRIFKNKASNFKVNRTQIQYGLSEKFLEFLGFGLEEFKLLFLSKGFPPIYTDIFDINDIQQFYFRDLNVHQKCMKQKTHKFYSQPISVAVKTRSKVIKRIRLFA